MNVRFVLACAAIPGTVIGGVLLAKNTGPSTASPDLKGAQFSIVDAHKGPFLIESISGKTWFVGTNAKGAMGWLPVPLLGDDEATANAAVRMQLPPSKDPAQAPGPQVRPALERDGYIRRKLDLSLMGYIGIRAMIQDRPVKLLVDTGSPNTYLDRKRTEALGFKWDEAEGLFRLGLPEKSRGDAEKKMYLFASIMLGGYETKPVRIYHHDLTDINTAIAPYRAQKGFDGILGTDVLDHCSAVIDFKTHDIYLMERRAR